MSKGKVHIFLDGTRTARESHIPLLSCFSFLFVFFVGIVLSVVRRLPKHVCSAPQEVNEHRSFAFLERDPQTPKK